MNHLRETRLSRGFPRQCDLARRAGLSIALVSMLERDKYEPPPPTKRKLLRAMGLTMSERFHVTHNDVNPPTAVYQEIE